MAESDTPVLNAVRERPIIFGAESVRAILDGRKTQTRRVVCDATTRGNYKASELLLDNPLTFGDPGPSPAGNPGWYLHAPINCEAVCSNHRWGPGDCDPAIVERLYPWVFEGDRLWVRETWAGYEGTPHEWDLDAILYRADPMYDGMRKGDFAWQWKSPIHMPRWASRITLELTGLRVERLQEISQHDACAEGPTIYCGDHVPDSICIAAYRSTWDSLNAKRGFGWEMNPWVWVIEFAKVAT